MARAFAEIAFTPSVLEMQAAQGSDGLYANFLEPGAEPTNAIGAAEAAFIAARDGFYQATVSETGWPYVQFRGGPKGFLEVLDRKRIAYADYRGNRQYLSNGNLKTDDRVSLILMDYPNRRRLKVWGRARLVSEAEDPDLIAALFPQGYRAKAERAVVITIEALDWNCPQHIPQRLTVEELGPVLNEMERRISDLTAETARLKAELALAQSGR